MKAILEYIEQDNLEGILVRQTGDMGLDSWEPVVQVTLGHSPTVTYGHVTPAIARRILQEHIVGGQAVLDHVIPR
jgi:NADP-reducing hydrogenase subunit HndB